MVLDEREKFRVVNGACCVLVPILMLMGSGPLSLTRTTAVAPNGTLPPKQVPPQGQIYLCKTICGAFVLHSQKTSNGSPLKQHV